MRIFDVDGNVVLSNREYYENLAREALTGKVLITLGDSYTGGMKTRFDELAQKYGMIHDPRYVVGSAISQKASEWVPAKETFVERTQSIVSDYTNGYTINGTTYHADDVGLITFMGGANDDSTNAWIGDGINDTDIDTIYGALNYIFDALQETFTNAKFICILQPTYFSMSVSAMNSDAKAQTFGFDSMAQALEMDDVQFTNYCMTRKERAVQECAWAYHLPILDLFHTFPSVFNSENRDTYWLSDKLHPTQAGYDIVKAAIDKKIAELYMDD